VTENDRENRPMQFHPRPFAEPRVTLSRYTAPTRWPHSAPIGAKCLLHSGGLLLRPLYAGRRLSSHQAANRLVPEVPCACGFDGVWVLNGASSNGSLSFVSRLDTCSRYCLEL
jgi:hypothetical protein